MRQLNSGKMKLFNIRTDYREENDLASTMPDKVAEMEAIRRNYVEEVDGGSAEQAREALYKTMDKFSSQRRLPESVGQIEGAEGARPRSPEGGTAQGSEQETDQKRDQQGTNQTLRRLPLF